MIPENLKRSIDRYKSKVPTDEELTAIFDEINAANLKGFQQEDVCNYLQKVIDEAPANIEAEQERKVRKQRIAERKVEATKKRKQEEIEMLLGVNIAIPVILLVFRLIGIVMGNDFSFTDYLGTCGLVCAVVNIGGCFYCFKNDPEMGSPEICKSLRWKLLLIGVCWGVVACLFW